MALAAESEFTALFITAREMIPHRQTLIAMGWPQSKSPIQMDTLPPRELPTKLLFPAGPR
jgi:hypothetical protein